MSNYEKDKDMISISHMSPTQLTKAYGEICEEYARRLCDMYDWSRDDAFWVTDTPGTTFCACGCEHSLSMDDIRILVDKCIPYKEFTEWENYNLLISYAKSAEPENESIHYVNLHSWLNGAPLPLTPDELKPYEERYWNDYREAENASANDITPKRINCIHHICVNDWDFVPKTESCQRFMKTLDDALRSHTKPESQCNISYTNIDMAIFYLITCDDEFIENNNLHELLEHECQIPLISIPHAPFTINMWRKYNPDKWNADDNFTYFDYDALNRSLYLFVDDNEDEILTDRMPLRISKWRDYYCSSESLSPDNIDAQITEHMKNEQYRAGLGWCRRFSVKDGKLNIEKGNFIKLPMGFIRKYTGKKLSEMEFPIAFDYINPLDVRIWNE